MRRTVVMLSALAALATVGTVVVVQTKRVHVPFLSDTCRVFADHDVVRLAPDQITHAATIAAVGVRQQMPQRGIAIALATALQESKLRNLPAGDRDSIGLFQQRPSQGWGTPAQLQEPRYATAKFYQRLRRVPGWQQLSINDAAQAVQHSGTPSAYAKWEADATAMATAFLGGETGAVTCQLRQETQRTGADGAKLVIAELALDIGRLTVSAKTQDQAPTLTVAVGSGAHSTLGWRAAHWFVAKSHDYGIQRVAHAGVVWTADSGKWQVGGGTPDDRIDVALVAGR